MKRWLRVILVSSLVANVGLATGGVVIRRQFRSQAFGVLADTAQANARESSYILGEVKTRAPERLDALEAFLQESINGGTQAQEAWSVGK